MFYIVEIILAHLRTGITRGIYTLHSEDIIFQVIGTNTADQSIIDTLVPTVTGGRIAKEYTVLNENTQIYGLRYGYRFSTVRICAGITISTVGGTGICYTVVLIGIYTSLLKGIEVFTIGTGRTLWPTSTAVKEIGTRTRNWSPRT